MDIYYYYLPARLRFTAVTIPMSVSVGMSTIMTSPAPTLPRLRPNQTYFVLIVGITGIACQPGDKLNAQTAQMFSFLVSFSQSAICDDSEEISIMSFY